MPLPPVARLTAGAIIISFAPVFVRVADVGPTVAGFYRMAIGGVALAAVLFARGQRHWGGHRHVVPTLAAAGLVTADLWLWHRSIHYVGPGLATILANLQVLFLALIGVLVLGERLTRRVAGAIALAVLGLVLMVGVHWGSAEARFRVGSLFGVLAALAYTFFLLALRRARSRTSVAPMVTVCVLALAAAVFLGLVSLSEQASFAVPNRRTAAALAGLGLGPQVMGWVLITGALPRVRAATAGLLLLLQPALSFLWDMTFFGRPTRATELAGAALALAGIYLGSTARPGPPIEFEIAPNASAGAAPAGPRAGRAP